jgi:hypothetical protein
MIMERMGAQKRIEIPHMAASKRFGRYKDEKEKALREPCTVQDRALEKLISKWNRFRRIISSNPADTVLEDTIVPYSLASEMIRSRSTSNDQLMRFCVSVAHYEPNEKERDTHYAGLGLFISAMIELSRRKNFVIPADIFPDRLYRLGYRNTKKLLVDGTVDCVGWKMQAGEILVKGDVKEQVGRMMTGGKITVMGFAAISTDMMGGELHLNGEVGWFGGWAEAADLIKHGKVYHRGKLMVDK